VRSINLPFIKKFTTFDLVKQTTHHIIKNTKLAIALFAESKTIEIKNSFLETQNKTSLINNLFNETSVYSIETNIKYLSQVSKERSQTSKYLSETSKQWSEISQKRSEVSKKWSETSQKQSDISKKQSDISKKQSETSQKRSETSQKRSDYTKFVSQHNKDKGQQINTLKYSTITDKTNNLIT